MLSRSILNKSGQAYMLDKEAASGIRRNLSAEETVFWKCQAFITEYRAIPWKYIESSNINVSTILPHLRYTVSSYKDCFERSGSNTRADIALTLLESARFPTMSWKRFAGYQAEVAARGIQDVLEGSTSGPSEAR
ncbi:hypothetical protein F5883DRAFT_208034 [Diaporthe sp. PMI_573]|nr:hypothetical protein F5883DRAFT_208034 [Diaporthaceae sp. PMI_573]